MKRQSKRVPSCFSRLLSLLLAAVLLLGTVSAAGVEQFRDLEDYQGDASIAWALEQELFQGVSQDEFAPTTGMTRAMFVTVMARLAGNYGIRTEGYAKAVYSDVPEETWYRTALNWANGTGLIKGYPDGTFRPDVLIDREMICTLVHRFAVQILGFSAEEYETGAPEGVADWAKAGVAFCQNLNLARWDEDAPTVFRAEMAGILHALATAVEPPRKSGPIVTVHGTTPSQPSEPEVPSEPDEPDEPTEPEEPAEQVIFTYDFATSDQVNAWKTDVDAIGVRYRNITVDGQRGTYAFWIRRALSTAGQVAGAAQQPLEIRSPALQVSGAGLEKMTLRLEYIQDAQDVPLDLEVLYSTDSGETWSALTMTASQTDAAWENDAGTERGAVGVYTSEDLVPLLGDKTLTNLCLKPFGDEMTMGAFRVCSITLTGTGDQVEAKQPVYTPTHRDDAPYLQSLIDAAQDEGQDEVTLPSENPNGEGSLWQIGSAIVVPAGMTVRLADCTLRLNDGVYSNIFISQTAFEASNVISTADEEKNLAVIGTLGQDGMPTVKLEGGVHNGYREANTKGSAMYGNCPLFFRNVNGFEVKNLHVDRQRYWGLTFNHSLNGEISNIHFSRVKGAYNQDGIDLRIGCSFIKIHDITGVCGDDVVALTALTGGDYRRYGVAGREIGILQENADYDGTPYFAIHDVEIYNVNATCGDGHGCIRLLNQDGNLIYNINIHDITDLETAYGDAALRISMTSGYMAVRPCKYGEMYNVSISKVKTKSHAISIGAVGKVTSEHVNIDLDTIEPQSGQKVKGLTIEDNSPITPYVIPENAVRIYSYTPTEIIASTLGWTSNNYDNRHFAGTVNDAAGYQALWSLGSGKIPGAAPLFVATPEFGFYTPGLYTTVKAAFSVFSNGSDPSLENMQVFYSTDGGATWSDTALTLKDPQKSGTYKTSENEYPIYTYETQELKDLGAAVTNLKIMPYGDDGSLTVGAFRLLGFDLFGIRTDGTTAPEPEPEEPEATDTVIYSYAPEETYNDATTEGWTFNTKSNPGVNNAGTIDGAAVNLAVYPPSRAYNPLEVSTPAFSYDSDDYTSVTATLSTVLREDDVIPYNMTAYYTTDGSTWQALTLPTPVTAEDAFTYSTGTGTVYTWTLTGLEQLGDIKQIKFRPWQSNQNDVAFRILSFCLEGSNETVLLEQKMNDAKTGWDVNTWYASSNTQYRLINTGTLDGKSFQAYMYRHNELTAGESRIKLLSPTIPDASSYETVTAEISSVWWHDGKDGTYSMAATAVLADGTEKALTVSAPTVKDANYVKDDVEGVCKIYTWTLDLTGLGHVKNIRFTPFATGEDKFFRLMSFRVAGITEAGE